MRFAGRVAEGVASVLSCRGRCTLLAANLTWADSPVLLAFGGFIAWCGYLWVRFGDPLLWEHIQSVPGWDQGSGPTTWFKVFLLDQLATTRRRRSRGRNCAGPVRDRPAVRRCPRIARRFGWSYAAFTAGVLLLPIVGTKDFMGTGRYLLVAFPDLRTGRPVAGRSSARLRAAVLAVSGLLLVFLTTLFARGHYLA